MAACESTSGLQDELVAHRVAPAYLSHLPQPPQLDSINDLQRLELWTVKFHC